LSILLKDRIRAESAVADLGRSTISNNICSYIQERNDIPVITVANGSPNILAFQAIFELTARSFPVTSVTRDFTRSKLWKNT
jgi:hypothetical protein